MNPEVIVVDDEAPIVELVCEVLNDEAIAAEGCPHGRSAYRCIRGKHPKLVILDIQMPEVDGIELFHQMRADPETSKIPVIFFTANAIRLEQRLPDYEVLGAQLLPKPFHVDRLLEAVSRALGT